MGTERVVLCGGVPAGGRVADPVELDIYGRTPNVNVRLEEVRRALWTDIPPVLRDLLDVAAYVYAADQAVPRANGGRVDGPEVGAGWRRAFRFRIPVREPGVWSADPVRDALVSALSFLSEDEYAFEFVPIKRDKKLDGFIDFDTTPYAGHVSDVQLYSGGLDSLGGAVAEAVTNRRRVLLLNHRPVEKLTRRYADLLGGLRRHAGVSSAPLHVAVRVNKRKRLGKEYTQRTRSFLFAALGVTFARMSNLDRLRFFENGVVSLNLPLSAQVVGARASRTTHPRVLAGFARLFTALLGRPFGVENPFLWRTKTDVVKGVADAGCGDLIGLSTSCAHTWARTAEHTHCGVCSQCLDRRFAVLAAGQGAHDPAGRYAVDLLVGERKAGEQRVMLAAYLDLVQRVERMDAGAFLAGFGELSRVLGRVGLTADAAGVRVFELYKTHARQVAGVIDAAIASRARAIRRRELPATSLLRIVYDDGTAEPTDDPGGDTPNRLDADNSFVRRGRCWAIRFNDGRENIYTPDRGFDYLRLLLERPGAWHEATALRAALCRRACARPVVAAGDTPTGSGAVADDVMDAEGIGSCESRLRAIDELRSRLEAGDDPNRVEQIEILDAERQQITAALGTARGRGGRSRKMSDLRERVRKSVGNAIRRALRQIHDYDRALSDHLTRPVLNLGHDLCYAPGEAVTWHLED